MADEQNLHTGSGSTPIPDPTLLTTQALVREISALREILEAQILGQRQVLESRLDGMDKAIGLLQNISDKQSTLVDNKVSALKTLHEERFASIQVQFTERDVRTEQTSRDSKVAVDAALQAAKELGEKQNQSSSLAVSKSEAATDKRIDALGVLITATDKGSNDKIDDLKQRLTRMEGQGGGMKEMWGYILGAVGALLAVASFAYTLMKR